MRYSNSIRHPDSHNNVLRRRWHLLWYDESRCNPDCVHVRFSISCATTMVIFAIRSIIRNLVESLKLMLTYRLETVQTIFVFIAGIMGALGLMILFIGFLTTGATRHRVCRAWRARVGGRVSCMVVSKDRRDSLATTTY
jgi:hypothetical protein